MTDINQVQETLKPGDVVLGDRLFSNWGHLALLGQRGAFGLFKMHHSRKALFGSHQDYGPSRRFVKKLGHKICREVVVEIINKIKAIPSLNFVI